MRTEQAAHLHYQSFQLRILSCVNKEATERPSLEKTSCLSTKHNHLSFIFRVRIFCSSAASSVSCHQSSFFLNSHESVFFSTQSLLQKSEFSILNQKQIVRHFRKSVLWSRTGFAWTSNAPDFKRDPLRERCWSSLTSFFFFQTKECKDVKSQWGWENRKMEQ